MNMLVIKLVNAKTVFFSRPDENYDADPLVEGQNHVNDLVNNHGFASGDYAFSDAAYCDLSVIHDNPPIDRDVDVTIVSGVVTNAQNP